MSSPDKNPFAEQNPYAPPTTPGGNFSINPSSHSLEMSKLVKDFRAQSLALGVAWLIFGGLVVLAICLLLVVSLTPQQFDATLFPILIGLMAISGIGWLAGGVGTLMKQVWGIYVGLVMSYFALVGNLLNFNICGLVIIIFILVQAHRVLTFANRM